MSKNRIEEIDIDQIMEKIRKEVNQKRQKSYAQVPDLNSPPSRVGGGDSNTEILQIRSILSSIEARADVGQLTSMVKFRRVLRPLAILVGKTVVYLSSFITDRQTSFNKTIIQILYLLINSLEKTLRSFQKEMIERMADVSKSSEEIQGLRTETEFLKSQINRLNNEQQNIEVKLGDLKREIADVYAALEDIQGLRVEIERLKNEIDHLKKGYEFTNASKADVQYVNGMEKDIKNILMQLKYQKLDLLDQQRRLMLFLEEARKRFPDPIAADQIKAILGEEDYILNTFYLTFEDQFRGTREDIKERFKVYLPYIEQAEAGFSANPILDIGCGRGEWLELLRGKNYVARGVDINKIMVNQCSEFGLDALEGDAVDYLRNQKPNSLGGITGFHLIEHLPFKSLIILLDEALRVLKPRGIVIFETPNPENVLVGSCNFYLDPSHIKPLPSPMIKFLMEARGFCRVEILNLHPYPMELHVEGSDLANRFNEYFYGPQDYAVIGYKV